MVIFHETWKKCNEIQLIKNILDLNKSKTKNIKALLGLEPNFPGVATVYWLPKAANELSA